jgi:hypothetical protein
MSKVPPALPAIRAELGLTIVESDFIHTVMYGIGGVLAGLAIAGYERKL